MLSNSSTSKYLTGGKACWSTVLIMVNGVLSSKEIFWAWVYWPAEIIFIGFN